MGISYVSKFRFLILPPSKINSSVSVYPRPMVIQPSICMVAPSGFTHNPISCAQAIRITSTLPVFLSTFTSAICATQVPASVPQLMPIPLPLGVLPGLYPNLSATAFRHAIIFSSFRFFNRNSSGSSPAAAAIISICDSLAKVFVFAFGARQAPVSNG